MHRDVFDVKTKRVDFWFFSVLKRLKKFQVTARLVDTERVQHQGLLHDCQFLKDKSVFDSAHDDVSSLLTVTKIVETVNYLFCLQIHRNGHLLGFDG